MKHRAVFVFRCVSEPAYYEAHKDSLGSATRELVEFMRACGKCSSWAWHGDSAEAYEIAKVLIRVSAKEAISTQQSAISHENRRVTSSNGVGDRARVAGVSSPESTATLGGNQSAQVTLPFDREAA